MHLRTCENHIGCPLNQSRSACSLAVRGNSEKTGRMTKDIRFPEITPPQAEIRPVADTRHNITRIDEYGWLRAENWQEVFRDPATLDPAIRAHLEAENTYQSALMEDTSGLRKMLFA